MYNWKDYDDNDFFKSKSQIKKVFFLLMRTGILIIHKEQQYRP